MNESKLVIVARIQAKPNKHEELERELLILVLQTQKEEGCIQFDLYKDNNEVGVYILWECFVNQYAFDKHLQAPYTKAYFEKAKKHFLESVESTKLNKLT